MFDRLGRPKTARCADPLERADQARAVDVKDDVITVQGEESHGKYVEIVERKTGKTLANDVRK